MHKHIRGQCTFITIPIDTYVEKRGMKNEKRSKFGLANGGRGKNGLYFFMCCSLPFFLLGSLLQFSKLFITYKATTNAHINAQN